MKYALRPYQEKGIELIRDSFKRNNHVLYTLPTGGGKTIVFVNIAERMAKAGRRVLVLVHRKELLDQASEKLYSLGVPHGVICPNRTQTGDLIQVASVDTLIRRLSRTPRPDLIICDEAHHCIPGNKWGSVVSYYRTRLLGVTATPVRMQGTGLGTAAGGFFQTMIVGPTIRNLIDQGYLSDPITYAPPVKADLTGVQVQAGDYLKSELSIRMDKGTITGDAVNHYATISPGLPALVFCVSVGHADHVAQQFRDRGYRFEMINGTMSASLRASRIADLASGRLQGLTSCDIVSEGTDIPVVSVAILLRPTKSTGLFLQQSGRALRMYPGKKNTIILDHVGNVQRFGLIDEPRAWTLDTPLKEQKESDGSTRMRSCSRCFRVYPVYAPRCPQCGLEHEKQDREIEQVEGVLQMIDREQWMKDREEMEAKQARKKEEGSARTLEDLKKIEKIRGYREGWAWHRFNARQHRKAV